MSLESILQEIGLRRGQQDKKWGGPSHDDTHSEEEWQELILGIIDPQIPLQRYNFLDTAALAIAALESWDRTHEG